MRKILLPLILLLLYCSPAVSDSLAEKVEVGVLASLTGEWAAAGDMTVKGIELALEEYDQDKNNVEFELLVEDTDESDSGAKAVTAYKSLRARGIKYFIGPIGTPAALALAPIIKNEKDVVVITPSVGVSDFHLTSNRIFNTRGVDEVLSKQLVAFAFKNKWPKAAVFATLQPWETVQGEVFAAEFKNLGGEIVSHQTPPSESNDMQTPALKIIKAKPDVVFLATYNKSGPAARALRTQGYKGPLLSVNLDTSRLESAAGALEGTVFAMFTRYSSNFQKLFKEKYNIAPSFPADKAYDAMYALIKSFKSKPKDLSAALLKKSYAGSVSDWSFDNNGCATRTTELMKVENNKLVPY